jgi:hypothetical protein
MQSSPLIRVNDSAAAVAMEALELSPPLGWRIRNDELADMPTTKTLGVTRNLGVAQPAEQRKQL